MEPAEQPNSKVAATMVAALLRVLKMKIRRSMEESLISR
jgi:hypothetical protein